MPLNQSERLPKTNNVIVNILLKFQMLTPEICHDFLLKKCEKLLQKLLIFFSTKNINAFGYEVLKHLTS